MAAQSEEMEIDQVVEEVDEKVIDDEARDEPQEEEEAEGENEDEVEDEVEEDEGQPSEKKRSRNLPKPFTRELGKSVLPFARVQKIIKADKVGLVLGMEHDERLMLSLQDIPMVAKDAVFLISIATEAFIEELAQAGQRVADRHNRTMIHHEDIGRCFVPMTPCSQA
jgi:histone H3/H4